MSEPRLVRPKVNRRYTAVWYVAWSAGGRSYRVSTGREDRDEAEAWLKRWRALRDMPRSAGTVAELITSYTVARKAEGVRADTLKWNLAPIVPHFGPLAPEEVSAPYVRGYLVRRRSQGVRDSTISRELRSLRAALHWGEREGLIDRAPKFTCPGAAPARARWLTRTEYDRLIAAIPSLHVRVFLTLGVYTGARQGAILGLRWAEVDFENALVLYPRKGSTKKVSPKVMPSPLRAVLEDARGMAASEWVIEYPKRDDAGDQIMTRVYSVRNALLRAAKAAKVVDFRVHDLRRTCAVWMLHAGASFSQVAAQLDDDVRTVQKHYAHHAPGYLRDVLERM